MQVKGLSGKLIRDSATGIFTGHLDIFCLAHSKIARFSEEFSMFDINHIACTSNLGPLRHSYQGMVQPSPNPHSQMTASGQPSEHTFLRITISGLLRSPFSAQRKCSMVVLSREPGARLPGFTSWHAFALKAILSELFNLSAPVFSSIKC